MAEEVALPLRTSTRLPVLSDREALEQRFRKWPSFHDAELQAVRLDSGQQTDGKPSVELDIHVFDIDGVLPNGRLNFVCHTLATLRFEGAEAIVLDGFGPQNVLDDLVLQDLGNKGSGAGRMLVSLRSSNSLDGSLRCEHAIVLAASDFEPGPHSGLSPSLAAAGGSIDTRRSPRQPATGTDAAVTTLRACAERLSSPEDRETCSR